MLQMGFTDDVPFRKEAGAVNKMQRFDLRAIWYRPEIAKPCISNAVGIGNQWVVARTQDILIILRRVAENGFSTPAKGRHASAGFRLNYQFNIIIAQSHFLQGSIAEHTRPVAIDQHPIGKPMIEFGNQRHNLTPRSGQAQYPEHLVGRCDTFKTARYRITAKPARLDQKKNAHEEAVGFRVIILLRIYYIAAIGRQKRWRR